MSDLGQAAFDHAAILQQRVDRLELELGALAVAGLGLALAILILTYRMAHDG